MLNDDGIPELRTFPAIIYRENIEHHGKSVLTGPLNSDVIKELTRLRGIGKWTAKMYLRLVLDSTDIIPAEDEAFLHVYRWVYKTDDCNEKAGYRKCRKRSPYAIITSRFYYEALDLGLTKEEFHLSLEPMASIGNICRKDHPVMSRKQLPKLPPLLERKISKTSQTRGADDDVIYQNRVRRNNTVLIPFHQWQQNAKLRKLATERAFEKGYIVLIPPSDYFSWSDPQQTLSDYFLVLGINSLVFYETRNDWDLHNPEALGWKVANSRQSPLGGQYVARIPATTAIDSAKAQKINLGYASQSPKGAGIRLYEYANQVTITSCRQQLEAEYWLCYDSIEVASENGMTKEDALYRKEQILELCKSKGLLDYERLRAMRIINNQNHTICPLCLKELSGNEFLNRLEQPEGREVPDLTVTQVNLFHIDELKYGAFNHKPYNLGWGHHFCNVVVKDSGIEQTLEWMISVLKANREAGYIN